MHLPINRRFLRMLVDRFVTAKGAKSRVEYRVFSSGDLPATIASHALG
jgi:hypothetical protein